MQNRKACIITYGCSNNQNESRIMAGLLQQAGFSITNEENADIVIVNTCSVKNKTESKILHRLSTFGARFPEKKLIVAGCLPEADIKRVKKHVKGTSIVGTNHITKITTAATEDGIVEFVGKDENNRAGLEKIGLPKIREGAIDIITISNGCASSCTFCSTKLAKGNLMSYDENKIVEEIRAGKIGGGAKEFWLTSQDCGCYGFETGTNAAALLKNITSSVHGEYFLRLGMANPQHVKRILPELIEAYQNDHIFKFLHVPVQSGSEKVLREMRRGHTVEDFKRVVNEFRRAFPEITIWTDMIVGFPGETEEDFSASIQLLQEARPDVVNISMYSSRPGTRASKMKQIQSETIKERTGKMNLLAKDIYLQNNKKWLGWSGNIIVDEFKETKGNFIGRNYAYKPVVVRGNYRLGQIVDVKIEEASSMCLFGEEIK